LEPGDRLWVLDWPDEQRASGEGGTNRCDAGFRETGPEDLVLYGCRDQDLLKECRKKIKPIDPGQVDDGPRVGDRPHEA
jgi:hypothetical protein